MFTFFSAVCLLVIVLLSAAFLSLQLRTCGLPSLKSIYNIFVRDIRAGFRYKRALRFIKRCQTNNVTAGDLLQDLAKKHPNKVCFLFEEEKWTYQQVEDYSNQIANAFETAGYGKGDEVALFMENRPEYPCIWMGLSKIGVAVALINTNLRMQSLAHSINVVNSKAIIFNSELVSAIKEAVPFLNVKSSIDYFCLGSLGSNSNSFHVKSLKDFLQNASKVHPDKKKHRVGFKDTLFYIYTSGTTGLPKAAIFRHSRYIWIGAAAKHGMLMRDDDIVYNCLPMYHTSGGALLLAVVLMFGGTMAIRKKFSASNFWKDAIKYKATSSIYIGEICRYLLNQPKSPEETQHTIRHMCGNGLRPHLWKEFKNRFKIREIVELYAATEGNANVVNFFGKVGAVGFIPKLLSHLYPVNLIRVDPETGKPIRDKNGLCIRCKAGEPGEIVGKIVLNNPVNCFDGYADESATRKKIVTNCFQKGDKAFLSGDILVMDEEGYLYFMDRTGDTFRWRGENVSTAEVEAAIGKVLGQVPCVVFGIEIPGVEGKAGMAAIQSDTPIDMDTFYNGIRSSLPSYALPVFVRICKNIESTGTYKLKKVEFQKEGFCPKNITDPIFMLDTKKGSYTRFYEEKYNQILKGEIRL